ncbi:MAG TPA: hypothetical protein VHN39_00890 [Phenylobacterium sp.]|nr:hypothetical protein [Phenylobacterium sp.]
MTTRTQRRTPWRMAPSDKDPRPKPLSREQQLAQALRANLQRRKAGERKLGSATPKGKSADEG